MHICIIGAGVVGVASAYRLAERGHAVTVLESRDGPGLETSFANGGQIAVSESAPWAGPGIPWKALKWLVDPDAPFRLRPRLDPDQWRFLWRMFRRCTSAAQLDGFRRAYPLALLSRNDLRAVRADLAAGGRDFDYDQKSRGVLRIYGDREVFDSECEFLDKVRDLDQDSRPLSVREVLEIEPALEPAIEAGKVIGGLYAPGDETGDAHLFTKLLAEDATRLGVEFRYGTEVSALRTAGDRVVAAEAKEALHEADCFVLSAGAMSTMLTRDLGSHLPIYPLKGYSVTLPIGGKNMAPQVSVTDEANRIVVTNLGDRLRAAGLAEVGGYDRTLDQRRAEVVRRSLISLFPNGGDPEKPEFWCGLRPMTPDGLPLIGRLAPWSNLVLNTGHGTAGWTLAMGSARLVSDLIDGNLSPVDPISFDPARF